MISGFCCKVDENWGLLGYYTTSSACCIITQKSAVFMFHIHTLNYNIQ